MSALDLFGWRPQPAAAPPARRPVVLAYGGGLDSYAALRLSMELGSPPDIVAFCDVSNGTLTREATDPGEWPGAYEHLRKVVAPLCEREGIEFAWIDTDRYPVRDARSLFSWMWARGQIPVAAGDKRICTPIAKTERFQAWMNDRFPGREVEVWVCFEAGEEIRAESDPNVGLHRRPRPGEAIRRNRFPLIEARMCRCRAEAYLRARGFSVPRKSACMFCPFNKKGDWRTCAREQPEAFALTVELEARKPPTSEGYKLSIAGFKKKKDKQGRVTGYRAPPLPVFIQGAYRPQERTCSVCGQFPKATKVVGSDWLYQGEDDATGRASENATRHRDREVSEDGPAHLQRR